MKLITKLIASLMFFAATSANSQQSPKHLNLNEGRIALGGFDPVAYFNAGKAIKGKESFVIESEGARYWFSTPANRDLFASSPASYKPQYGGWCAYAMGAEGEKVEVDPETFKVVDGKLYLFYNRFFNNTLETWNKNEAHLKASADRNWTKLTNHKN